MNDVTNKPTMEQSPAWRFSANVMSADQLRQVAGGCNSCELNPPSVMDAYKAQPHLYLDLGVNNDLRLASM